MKALRPPTAGADDSAAQPEPHPGHPGEPASSGGSIEELQRLYEDTYGKRLSRSDAERFGAALVRLVELVAKPRPGPARPDYGNRPPDDHGDGAAKRDRTAS